MRKNPNETDKIKSNAEMNFICNLTSTTTFPCPPPLGSLEIFWFPNNFLLLARATFLTDTIFKINSIEYTIIERFLYLVQLI